MVLSQQQEADAHVEVCGSRELQKRKKQAEEFELTQGRWQGAQNCHPILSTSQFTSQVKNDLLRYWIGSVESDVSLNQQER